MKNKINFSFDNLYIYTFFLIICLLGNFPRLIRFDKLPNNISLSELLLYLLGIIWILFNLRKFLNLYRFYIFLSIIISLSFMVGVVRFGFDLTAFLYAIRLILILMIISSLAIVAYEKFKNRYDLLFKRMLLFYAGGLIFGFLLYIFFPKSEDLWKFLSSFGIIFKGDPHINRFISIYFDPNFYASIGIIPILLSLLLYNRTQRYIYLVYGLLFIVSIFLTVSRSGIASFIMLFMYSLLKELLIVFNNLIIKRRLLYALTISFVLLFLTYPIYSESLDRLIERIVTIKNDDSAYARYLSFMFAIDIIRENLIFGTGYNYLASYMLSMGMLSSVDSSILTIICNFGVFLSIIIFFIVLIFLINLYIKVRTFNDVYLLSFVRYFYVYLIIIIFFSSNFNNILLYFFLDNARLIYTVLPIIA